MAETTELIASLHELAQRRAARRLFFRNTAGVAAGVIGGGVLGACGGGGGGSAPAAAQSAPAPAPAGAPTDAEILNFALNLEYLESSFYHFAVYGTGIPANLQTGVGSQGTVTGGSQVPFSDPIVAAYAKEIAQDELDHVNFLRTALGPAAVALPNINISGTDPAGSFSTAARAAGIIGAGAVFNPYLDDINFLLGAFIFEDVGVTAYKGASPYISNKAYLEAAAGILAAEAYHAGLVRTVLYSKGIQTPQVFTDVQDISNLRNALDHNGADDQGIQGADSSVSNIVPLDSNGLAYSRTTGHVLNIVYGTTAAATSGLFFPSGVNGSINASSAS
jgi:hypothetical protein